MTGLRITFRRQLEQERIDRAKRHGQVLSPVNLEAIDAGLGSKNHGRKRRALKALERAARRGLVVRQ